MEDIQKFEGLNISSKFAICGLPIRLDSYKTCTFGCRYCFANARKIMAFGKDLQIADVDSIRKRLDRIANRGGQCNSFLDKMIASGITWHCGGMSDPFQPAEKTLGVTKQILEVTNKYGIKILFSTKSDTVYDADIKPDLHTFQLSVSNINDRRDIEPNVPSIQKRIAFFHDLKRKGFRVGVRIQPFIPNISGIDIIKAFDGADHFTIEGLKIVPQNKEQREYVYNNLGFKESMFTQMGLLNIRPELRYEYYKPIIEYLKSHHISYSISDNDMRYLTNNSCCCGDALCKGTTFNTTSMVHKYGMEYSLSDVMKEVEKYGCADCKVNQLFASNRTQGCRTIKEFYNMRFNDSASPFSPKFQYYNEPSLF